MIIRIEAFLLRLLCNVRGSLLCGACHGPPLGYAAPSRCGSAQVHFMWPNGRGQLLAGLERARPGYGRLVALLQGVPGSQARAPAQAEGARSPPPALAASGGVRPVLK